MFLHQQVPKLCEKIIFITTFQYLPNKGFIKKTKSPTISNLFILYDWLKKSVYQTPAAHRIKEKKEKHYNRQDKKLVTENEVDVVMTQPKAYVPLSGSTMANKTHRLHCFYPDVHQMTLDDTSAKYSFDFRQFCAIFSDIFMMNDMTEQDDIKKDETYRDQKYKLKCLMHFLPCADLSLETVNSKDSMLSDLERTLNNLQKPLSSLKNHCHWLVEKLKEERGPGVEVFIELKSQAENILTFFPHLDCHL